MPLFALTIFLGALLLFLVQPLAGKFVLPWFGGGAGVWTVCLLFFQTGLLAGYAYAHVVTTRLRPRAQAALHVALLVAALAFLPIIPGATAAPADSGAPTVRLLWLLTRTFGVPYFALAATAPLLQRWLLHGVTAVAPYRLYALSNAGSLLGLFAYPFLLEPHGTRSAHAWLWSGGLVLFAALCAGCAWRVWRTAPGRDVANAASPTAPDAAQSEVTPWWIAWPAVASLLLAAITNRLTGDVAPMPFLWVVPLALYLLSFILCFEHPRWYARGVFAVLLVLGCGAVAWLLHAPPASLGVQLAVYPAVLFVACMLCHGEAYRLRPPAEQLTRFYLFLAAGGVVGTLFVAVLAPWICRDNSDVEIGLCAALGALGWRTLRERARAARLPLVAGIFTLVVAASLAVVFVRIAHADRAHVVAAERNFYGSLRVLDRSLVDPADRHLELVHGTTTHGTQFLGAGRSRWPTAYYGHTSGAGLVFEHFAPPAARKVGLVGLGAGTLATYGRAGDQFTFYEINPAVIAFARAPFGFLRESAAHIDIVPGDARLALETQARRGERQHCDVLVLDAFNGDAIPVHLLTAEAMEIYLQHLAPDGIIAVHITNRYTDLRGVTVGLARHFQMDFVMVADTPKKEEYWLEPSVWCLLTRSKELFREWLPQTADARRALEEQFHPVLWTDEHASLLPLLR